MRWVQFLILVWVTVVVQATLGGAVAFNMPLLGRIAPDLLAIVAVFVAVRGPNLQAVMKAAWVLGFAVDLTAVAGTGLPTVVGPMSIAYALSAGLIFQMREAIFGEQPVIQGTLALLFCAMSHLIWITAQAILGGGWQHYGSLIMQVIGISLYTALVMPVGFWALSRAHGLIIDVPVRRTVRSRRQAR